MGFVFVYLVYKEQTVISDGLLNVAGGDVQFPSRYHQM